MASDHFTGDDYGRENYTLNFDRGDTTHSFNVPITDDALAEPEERFTLRLEEPQTRSFICVARGSPESTQVVIQDNDC